MASLSIKSLTGAAFAATMIFSAFGTTTAEAANTGPTIGKTSNNEGRAVVQSPKPVRPIVVPFALKCEVRGSPQYDNRSNHISISTTGRHLMPRGTTYKWRVPEIGKSGQYTTKQTLPPGWAIEHRVIPITELGIPESVKCHARIVTK